MIRKLQIILFWSYLIVFPIGQLLRVDIDFNGQRLTVLAVDVLVGLIALFWFAKRGNINKLVNSFTIVLVFSYIFSLAFFKPLDLLTGGFYLVRILSYYAFCHVLSDIYSQRKFDIQKVLTILGLVIVSGGFVQYVFFPDLVALVPYGWDAHLYRLTGSFLDPGFTGIILVLAFLIAFLSFIRLKSKYYFIAVLFILIGLLLTYSRASYLAFLVSSVVLTFYLRSESRKLLIGIILIFLLAIPFLPRPRGEGVKLERTASVYQRVENYNSTVDLLSVSPLFGIGYNNMCIARNTFNVSEDGLHSCSGTDSSLLLLLITTGVVGVVSFLYELTRRSTYLALPLVTTSFVAILTHSLFQNSLFYPWVLGWFGVVVSLETSSTKDYK